MAAAGQARRLRADRARPTARTRSRWRPPPAATATTWVINGAEEVDRQRHPRRRRRASGPATSPTARSRASWSRRAPRATTRRRIDGKGSLRAVWQAEITLDRRAGARDEPAARREQLQGHRRGCSPAPGTPSPGPRSGHATAAYEIAAAYCTAAHPVRQAAGQLPDRAGAARQDARRGVLDAAVLPATRPAASRRARSPTPSPRIAKMNNTRKAREVVAEAPGPARRQRDPARLPRHTAHGRHRGAAHLRRHRDHPDPHRRKGYHRCRRLRVRSSSSMWTACGCA